jgi:hypothetical protein
MTRWVLHSFSICGGVVAGGALDVGVMYLEVVGARAAPRVGGPDCRKDHDEVRPAKILALHHGG